MHGFVSYVVHGVKQPNQKIVFINDLVENEAAIIIVQNVIQNTLHRMLGEPMEKPDQNVAVTN